MIKSKLMSYSDSDVYVYAHIHKPYIRFIDGKMNMNTGSVGLPFDGLARASYATIEVENGYINPSIHRVSYEVERVVKQYLDFEYPNAEMMINVLKNAKIG